MATQKIIFRYYDNAVEAIWMAKTYGMEFQTYNRPLSGYNSPSGLGPILNASDPAGEFFKYKIFTVRDNSCHLLEPRLLDMVETMFFIERILTEKDLIKVQGIFRRIIQRDDQPFFWPKEERL